MVSAIHRARVVVLVRAAAAWGSSTLARRELRRLCLSSVEVDGSDPSGNRATRSIYVKRVPGADQKRGVVFLN